MLFCFLVRAVQVIIPWHLKRCDSNRKALRFESRFWARSVGDSSGWKSVDRQRKYILDRSTLDRTVRSKSRAFGGAIQIANGRRGRDSNRERAAGSRFKSRAGGGAIQIPSGPIFNVFLTSFIAQQTAHCQNAGSRTINVLSAVAFQQWARFICARLTCTNRKPSLNRHCAATGDSLPTNWHSVAKRNIVPF